MAEYFASMFGALVPSLAYINLPTGACLYPSTREVGQEDQKFKVKPHKNSWPKRRVQLTKTDLILQEVVSIVCCEAQAQVSILLSYWAGEIAQLLDC